MRKLIVFFFSVLDYWFFNYVERKVFENERPQTIPKLKEKLEAVFADINQNHKDMIRKAYRNFVVRSSIIKTNFTLACNSTNVITTFCSLLVAAFHAMLLETKKSFLFIASAEQNLFFIIISD